ncbi:hypothetical protein [Haloarchaeobius amylolyticus]|uniref:hypothetical protein n=1 Tax=Haloarchaeobius amylolyticus TaxID=1198296 RepID=UPI0022722990|nr:hypothetical protein [Haloarchaeobius amylolyticus]
MGLFDRLRDLFGGSDDESTGGEAVGPAAGHEDAEATLDPRADPEGRGRGGVNVAREDAKSGSHGSHWDTVVAGDDAIMQAIMGAVESGTATEGRLVDGETVVGYRGGPGALSTLTIASEDGEIWSGYPVAEGISHDVTITQLIPWANGAEAQLSGELGDATASFFATNTWEHEEDYFGGERQVELAALAYDLNPAEAETLTDEDGNEFSTAGMAGFVPFEGGDVDDYIFQTTVETVTEVEFQGSTVYRMRVPLFRGDDGTEYQVMLYAAKRLCGDFEPEKGDDVEGVFWLQGRVH